MHSVFARLPNSLFCSGESDGNRQRLEHRLASTVQHARRELVHGLAGKIARNRSLTLGSGEPFARDDALGRHRRDHDQGHEKCGDALHLFVSALACPIVFLAHRLFLRMGR